MCAWTVDLKYSVNHNWYWGETSPNIKIRSVLLAVVLLDQIIRAEVSVNNDNNRSVSRLRMPQIGIQVIQRGYVQFVAAPLIQSCNFLQLFSADDFIPESLEDEGRSVLMWRRSCSRPARRRQCCPGWGQCNTFLQRHERQVNEICRDDDGGSGAGYMGRLDLIDCWMLMALSINWIRNGRGSWSKPWKSPGVNIHRCTCEGVER